MMNKYREIRDKMTGDLVCVVREQNPLDIIRSWREGSLGKAMTDTTIAKEKESEEFGANHYACDNCGWIHANGTPCSMPKSPSLPSNEDSIAIANMSRNEQLVQIGLKAVHDEGDGNNWCLIDNRFTKSALEIFTKAVVEEAISRLNNTLEHQIAAQQLEIADLKKRVFIAESTASSFMKAVDKCYENEDYFNAIQKEEDFANKLKDENNDDCGWNFFQGKRAGIIEWQMSRYTHLRREIEKYNQLKDKK